MVHEIKIKNCLSFREEQTLSFEATADRSFEDQYCVEVKPGLRLLKLGVLYGPNASGKSNLIGIIDFFREIVLKTKDDKFEEIDFVPFLLDKNSRHEDGEISLSFFVDKKQYIYQVKFNQEFIRSERLIYYPGSQPAMLFKRTYSEDEKFSEVEFGKKLGLSQKEKILLEGNTIPNSSVLSAYLKTNISNEILENVTLWFKGRFMNFIGPQTQLTRWANRTMRNAKNQKCKELTLELLRRADFNISDLYFEEKDEKLNDLMLEVIKGLDLQEDKKQEMLANKQVRLPRLFIMHETASGKFPLSYQQQSDGTKRYYGLGVVLTKLLEENKCLFVDELDISLHYELFTHFIKTFLSNAKESQLFFTTHNIGLLLSDFLRRDVIWFCEKDENGASQIYSASDFQLHKNASLFNAYRIGKLGAKPNLGDIFMEENG
ncbi:MAG: ATP-binding protein [Bacteroidota bacterium]